MSHSITALAALEAKQKLQSFEYDPGELGPEQVEIAVESCGICHSDLSMLDNDWGISSYPFVPGHEIVGRVVALRGRVAGGATFGNGRFEGVAGGPGLAGGACGEPGEERQGEATGARGEHPPRGSISDRGGPDAGDLGGSGRRA